MPPESRVPGGDPRRVEQPHFTSRRELRQERQYRADGKCGGAGSPLFLRSIPMNELIFVGIDWATTLHAVCVMDAFGQVLGTKEVAHRATDLATMCDELSALVDSQPDRVHVAIEVPHGAVVDTLLERGFTVYSINPKQLDRFRDRFFAASAKDDRRDAHVLADSLRTDRRAFRRLMADEPLVIELREYSRIHDDLAQERVQLTNRLREQLRRYFPAFLRVADDPADSFARALFKLVPTPDHAVRIKPYRIAALLKKHRIRRIDADTVLAALREPKLIVAEGTVPAAIAHIQLLYERIATVIDQQKQVRSAIDRLMAIEPIVADLPRPSGPENDSPATDARSSQRDLAILRSIPGVGRIVAATLLSEASRLLQARDYHGLRALSGIAPVTRRSGKRISVGMRKACHRRLRNALHAWASVAVIHDPASKLRYAELRARGARHGRALRTIGDRLLRIACAMLRDQTTWRPRPIEVATVA